MLVKPSSNKVIFYLKQCCEDWESRSSVSPSYFYQWGGNEKLTLECSVLPSCWPYQKLHR